MNDDHSKITGGLFHSRSQEKRLTAQVPEIAALKARLSRYEAAMREALNANGAPLGAWQDPRMVLLAAGNRTDRVHEILRAALFDQPADPFAEVDAGCFPDYDGRAAEEPAESKLEAPNELLKLVAQAFFIIGSLELSSSGNREANETASAWRKKASAILDAQPSTPEEGAKETKHD